MGCRWWCPHSFNYLAIVSTTVSPSPGTCVGFSYRWLAPEVVTDQAYSTAADVYSFGLILWELLTWQLPWADLGPFQVTAPRLWCSACHAFAMLIVHVDSAYSTQCYTHTHQQHFMYLYYASRAESCWFKAVASPDVVQEVASSVLLLPAEHGTEIHMQMLLQPDWHCQLINICACTCQAFTSSTASTHQLQQMNLHQMTSRTSLALVVILSRLALAAVG